jgi:hypothetical protein
MNDILELTQDSIGYTEYGYVVWSGVYHHHYSKSKTNNLGSNTYYSNNPIVIWIYVNYTMWFDVVRILDQYGIKSDLGE